MLPQSTVAQRVSRNYSTVANPETVEIQNCLHIFSSQPSAIMTHLTINSVEIPQRWSTCA